jgi:hypothetical protein
MRAETMTTSKEYQNKEEVYSSEDRKLIISLLDEYSVKLLTMCDRIDKHQRSSYILSMLQIGLTILIATLLVFTLSGLINSAQHILSNIFTIISSFSTAVLFALFLTGEIYYNKKKLSLLERDAHTLTIKLKKVIRLASQIQEHVLNNVVSRIELDLRLADAESAVQHYEGKKKIK